MSLILATAVVVALAIPEVTNDPYALAAPRHGSWHSAARASGGGETLAPLAPVSLLQPSSLQPVAPLKHPLVAKWWPLLTELRWCESRGDYTVVNTQGSGAGGAFQFLPSTWRSVGGVGEAQHADPEEQDYRAALMLERGRRGEWMC